MKHNKHIRWLCQLSVLAAVLLIAIGAVALGRTFSHYNELSVQRQDSQLENMAQATDAAMTSHLQHFRDTLRYVIGRRGFTGAEALWHETGDAAELVTRMQENLITSNALIHNMLAIRDGIVAASATGVQNYYFPDGMDGALKPCFAGDGSMYLALFEEGLHASYAVLLSMEEWYAELVNSYASDSIRLMLMGSQQRILLHTWQGSQCVTVMDDLSAENCDMQAVRCMIQSHNAGQRQTVSYNLTYPGDSFVHEMRMAALPLSACTNGYFTVGLTSDYDEIILPIQAAAWRLIVSGALIVLGVLVMLFMAIILFRSNRHRDRELEQLIQRNEETRKLLEKTTELAHHQRLETIGTLTASIAHEFNNLLTPIMGYAILTLEKLPEESEDLADNVAEIYEASRKAKTIISRLNALSRKNPEGTFTPLPLASLLEKSMQVAAPAQPARVSTRLICEDNACVISGNETQLSQMLLNLILNAYHAMTPGGGTLTLTLHTEGEEAVVTVQDEGTGIPDEMQDRIFDPFFTTKAAGQGTGLGLAIVQQVVQSHQGRILVESVPDHGSTFTLRFPLIHPAENADS